MLKLSIIIPYYNTYDLTVKLLKHLETQKTNEVEIIIVDDGCYETRFDDYDFIKVIHNEKNLNAPTSWNIGINNANGEYIAFIDSDDMLVENYVELILSKIKENPNADIHHFRTRYYPLGNTVMFSFSLWDRVISKKFLDKNNITFNDKLTNMEDWNLRCRIERVPFEEVQHQEILYIY